MEMLTPPTIDLNIPLETRETTQQPAFQRKLGYLLTAPATSLFERGYYCNFPLHYGYPKALPTAGLHVIRNQVYHPQPEDSRLQSLDIFAPGTPASPLPVFVFIHGGAWRSADKSKGLHVHENLCIRLSHEGVVCVNVNHRLAPKVKFPTAEQDIALALKWVFENISQFGGDPERIFVGGHSSGGHIAALLATDSRYLNGVGLDPGVIKGVVSISGVMDIHGFYRHSRFHKLFSVRPYFGDDRALHEKATPLYHADRSTPPFLLLHAAEHDEGLDEQARIMEVRLRELNVPVRRIAYAGADHFLILSKVNEVSFPMIKDISAFLS